MSLGKVIIGIIISLTAGASLGILFAPKKGSKTRKKIFKKSENTAKDLEKDFNAFITGVQDKYETLGQEAEKLAKSGKSKLLKENSKK